MARLADDFSGGLAEAKKKFKPGFQNIDKTKDFCILKNKKGENEIFSQISVIKASMASAALPLVLQNIDINGEKFTDGGLLKNLPFDSV